MLLVVLATQSSHLTLFIIALSVALVIAVFGHIVQSRTMIITGILLIGLISAYFSFVLQPGGK